jgi:dipeptidyl aminopeptidase/acylaminoacyl peptidase
VARRRSFLFAIAALLPTLAAITAVYSVVRARRAALATIAPMKHAIAPAARAEALADFSDLRDISLRTSDGLTLHGWFSPGRSRAAIVFVHGGGGDRTTLVPEARALARHGYGFVLYDARACGESDGDRTTWGDRERRDLTAALDFVTTQSEIDANRVGVVGVSVGATAAALVAAKDTRVRAVVVSPVWTSFDEEMSIKTGRPKWLTLRWSLGALRDAGVDTGALDPIDHVREIAPRPIFFIAGEHDADTPVSVMQRTFDAASEPKRFWVVPNAGHGHYCEAAPSEYESRVAAFFDDALAR